MQAQASSAPRIDQAQAPDTAQTSIVLFTNSFLMGGMEEHVLQLATGLRERGFRVGVICSSTEVIQPLRDALSAVGAEVHSPPPRSRCPVGAGIRLLALIRILRAYPGCVLHLHLTGHLGGDLVAFAGRVSGARAILRTMHLPPVSRARLCERARIRLRDLLLDQIICASKQNLRAHLQLLGRNARKCILIRHGIDLERFSPVQPSLKLRAELGLAHAGPVIGTVARLGERRKGIADFLDMAATVASRRPDARFLIVGDGDMRPELERYAGELGLADRVLFTGERHDIPDILALMHVFVMPSHYEAGPYTLLEAMAMGRPVVSTSTGLAPEVIEDGQSGFLVPIHEAYSLSRAVLILLDNDNLAQRFGTHGRRQIERRHALTAMMEATVDAYRGLR